MMNWVWSLRPLVLFVAAYTIIGVVHESAHALIAYLFRVPFVLSHLYVHIDRATTMNERAVIGVAGPLLCLVIGLVCLFIYRLAKPELWLLYLGWFGVATLLGNLMSTAFVGDFSALAGILRLPMWLRYSVSIIGALSVCGFAFLVGREMRQWAPANVGRITATIGMIVIPVIAGTALTLLIYLPMPFNFAVARLGESSFWIFAAVGVLSRTNPPRYFQLQRVGLVDFALLLVAVGVLRLMAQGIAFGS